ncbi:hypothetical protein NECAME_00852 [Necator americanus]|uniref:Histone acetyltransferase type B catalytic subunit n=1 Tax=Necator americanus TaxID=51031 RepID=W2SNP2_NECAM|nr:hypothetical protein NECAME_00852 [Necator americanus]ETN71163.1 hypothetical protein NECAME_00852 [Necator americanus]
MQTEFLAMDAVVEHITMSTTTSRKRPDGQQIRPHPPTASQFEVWVAKRTRRVQEQRQTAPRSRTDPLQYRLCAKFLRFKRLVGGYVRICRFRRVMMCVLGETIYGYDDLAVNLYYSATTMFLYPELSFSTVVSSVEKDMKVGILIAFVNVAYKLEEDNIIATLKDQLPSDQMSMMVDSKEQFQVLLAKQKNFKPYGELITKFSATEDPADNFVLLRDYVDCVNCSKLPEFAPEKLKDGFTAEMRDAAQQKLKINKRQSRRVYEILRLKCTNMKNPAEAKAFRLDVKRRLELPMRRNERDWKKIQRALDDDEYAQVAASCVNTEQKMQQLQQLYEAEVDAYKMTIQRMTVHPDI